MKEHVKRHLVHKHGLPLMVMRPTTEEARQKIVRFMEGALSRENPEEAERLSDFASFMDEVGVDEYRFVGYVALGPNGTIVNESGKKVGRIEPGDSFVTSPFVTSRRREGG